MRGVCVGWLAVEGMMTPSLSSPFQASFVSMTCPFQVNALQGLYLLLLLPLPVPEVAPNIISSWDLYRKEERIFVSLPLERLFRIGGGMVEDSSERLDPTRF